MNTNNLIILIALGVGGYFIYDQLRPKRKFYKLPNGDLIPLDEAPFRLPSLGYMQTPYGWIEGRILEQLQERANAQSFSLPQFASNLTTVFSSVQTVVQEIKNLFPGQTDLNQLILGNPGTDYNAYV